jgi:hypothetical protein
MHRVMAPANASAIIKAFFFMVLLAGVNRSRRLPMARQSASLLRGAASRSRALSLAKRALLRHGGIAFGEVALDANGTFDGLHDARELSEQAIACHVEHAAAMVRELGNHRCTVRLQCREGGRLIGPICRL